MIDLTKCPPKFRLGRIMATSGVIAFEINFAPYLNRHVRGDWGELDSEDWERNEVAVANGSRILSAYRTTAGRIWIITEADRSVTTVLLPSEY